MGSLPKFWEEHHSMAARLTRVPGPGKRGLCCAWICCQDLGQRLESSLGSSVRRGGDTDSSPHSFPSSFSLWDVTELQPYSFWSWEFCKHPCHPAGADLSDSSAPIHLLSCHGLCYGNRPAFFQSWARGQLHVRGRATAQTGLSSHQQP